MTGQPGRLFRERELLERVGIFRDEASFSGEGVSDFGDVECAARIDSDVVRCDKAAGRDAIWRANACQYATSGIEDADATVAFFDNITVYV